MEGSPPPRGMSRVPQPPSVSPTSDVAIRHHRTHTVQPNAGAAPHGVSRIPSPSRIARPLAAGRSPSILDAGQKSMQSTMHTLQPKPPAQHRLPVSRLDLSKTRSASLDKSATTPHGKATSPGPPMESTSPSLPSAAMHAGNNPSSVSMNKTTAVASPSHANQGSRASYHAHGSPAASKQRMSSGIPSPASVRTSASTSINSSPAVRRPRTATMVSSPSVPRVAAVVTSSTSSPAASKVRPASAAAGSPSPGIARKTAARTSGTLDARRTGSVDKGKLFGNSGETRASILRRSASVDKMRSSDSAKATVARPTSALRGSTGARPAAVAAEPRQPQPPSQPAQPRPTRTSQLRANPSPARQPAQTSSSPASRSIPSPARRASVGAAPVSTVKAGTSILSTIHERAAAAAAAKGAITPSAMPSAPASRPVSASSTPVAAVKPMFSLNLAAVKAATEEPVQPEVEREPEEKPVEPAPVPKLNLTSLLQQQEDSSVAAAYAEPADADPDVAPVAAKSHGSKVKKPVQEPPEDHFYFYPKMDPNEERKTLEAIERLPKHVQKQMRRIYADMVEAKQNCEAIAFRGHRLLDQLQNHHKEKMETREQELTNEMQRYQRQANEAHLELQRIRESLARERMSAASAGVLQAPPGFGAVLDSPSVSLTSSINFTADSEADCVQSLMQRVEELHASSRNEVDRLRQAAALRQSMAGAGSMQEALHIAVADAVTKFGGPQGADVCEEQPTASASRDQGAAARAVDPKVAVLEKRVREVRVSDDATPMQDVA